MSDSTPTVVKFAMKGAAIMLALASRIAYADVSVVCESVSETLETCNIFISGEIKKTDAAKVASIPVGTTKSSLTYFVLDSHGGDIDAAMAIGRRLRADNGYVIVPESAVCASACVFLLAGATSRDVYGRVIVHRPYSTYVGDMSLDLVRAEREKLQTRIRQYLNDMDVAQQLLDVMDGVPSESGKQLTADELEAFRLSGLEPASQERFDAKEAARLGITRGELLQRKKECGALLSAVGTKELAALRQEIFDVYIPCMEKKRE